MVKQGNFAGSSKLKKISQFHQKAAKQVNGQLAFDKLADFMQVRYYLTQGNRQPAVVQTTMQRWLAVWLDQGTGSLWDGNQNNLRTLSAIANQVPWQFFLLVDRNHSAFEKFLKKELPLVPLMTRIKLVPANQANWLDALAKQLSLNWFLSSFANDSKRLAQITTSQVEQLARSFKKAETINWDNVAVVYQTVPQVGSLDEAPENVLWLAQLANISLN